MAANNVFSLKLLIDKNAHRVLFAEAGKDFVDFVFGFLSMPVGTITRLISREVMVGSIGNLYEGVENLNDAYMRPNRKDPLLRPRVPTAFGSANVRLYTCGSYYHHYVSDDQRVACPRCGSLMTNEVRFVDSDGPGRVASSAEVDYVKDLVTYAVMDDLSVMPMTSAIAVLNKCSIRDFEAVEEMVVTVGIEEGLDLLEASLLSKAALSYVFLWKKDFKDEMR